MPSKLLPVPGSPMRRTCLLCLEAFLTILTASSCPITCSIMLEETFKSLVDLNPNSDITQEDASRYIYLSDSNSSRKKLFKTCRDRLSKFLFFITQRFSHSFHMHNKPAGVRLLLNLTVFT